MSQGRSIIDIIQDPAALDAFLRSSAKASTNNSATTSGPQRRFDLPPTMTGATSTMPPNAHFNSQPGPTRSASGHIYNQNTTNNTNVQITQNTFNFNTNPLSTTVPSQQQQQQTTPSETTTVLNQTIGSQTNVNVILNQTVIQQPTVQTTTTTTGQNPQQQQQMVAININGNQTLIPLSMFTKLLQQKYATQSSTNTSSSSTSVPQPTTTIVGMNPTIVQNGSSQNGGQSILLQNNANSSPTTTLRLVRPPTTATSNIMMMTTPGQRIVTPTLVKPSSGNIIVQVTNNDNGQSRLLPTVGVQSSSNTTVSTNSDLTSQLMKDLEMNGKDPEKQIVRIDTYLSRMHSSPPTSMTEKDREFCTRILRYRETLSHSVEQARINGQHRQRLLDQSTTLNTLSSLSTSSTSSTQPTTTTTTLKRELPQQKPGGGGGGTTLIQLPLAKQDELLNAVLKKLRHVNLIDLQTQRILPMELTFEQKLQIQKLDMQIAALPLDKQQQFAQGQRELVPKYLAKNAASGLNTTSTLTVNPRTKILLGAVPGSTTTLNTTANANVARSLRISSSDLIGQQLRKDQMHVLKPDFKTRFLTRGDAIKRLTRYHVFTKPAPPTYEPTSDECRQFDEAFESEAKRLLAASERVSESITRFTISNNQFGNNSCDAYTLEKILLDDLREQCEQEKIEFEARKRRALDVENRPVAALISDTGSVSSPPSSTYDLLLPTIGSHLEPVMSDSAYFDLFNSDPIVEDNPLTRSDETQLAINSIVDYGIFEQHETTSIELTTTDTNNFFFDDDLDVDNSINNNESRDDDEASRAVQNLLGYS